MPPLPRLPVFGRPWRSAGALPAAAWGSLMLTALLALPGCSRPEPVTIGFLGGLSGRVADLGIAGRNGAQLAVDELNAAGGLGGRPVELLVRDDEQNTEVARTRMQELIDARVSLVIGPMTSSVALAVAPIATRLAVAVISPTSTAHELSGRADAFFRVIADASLGARQFAEYLAAQGHRRLAIAADHQNRAFSVGWSQAVSQRFTELGGQVVLELPFESAPKLDYGVLAQRLADAHGDVVLLVANAADSAMLIQQVRRRDERVQLATSSWAGTEQLVQLGGKAAEGTIVPQYHDRASQTPAYLRFAERFRQRFGELPGYPAVNGYDAVMLGAEALRRRREGQSVVDVLRGVRTHAGLQRVLSLDENGDAKAPLFLTRIRTGQFVPVEPQ